MALDNTGIWSTVQVTNMRIVWVLADPTPGYIAEGAA